MDQTQCGIINGILDGGMDEHLDAVVGAVRQRRTSLASRLRFELKRGDHVEIVGGIRPQSIVGLVVEVVSTHDSRVSVNMPRNVSAGRFAGQEVRVPMTCVKKTDEPLSPAEWSSSDDLGHRPARRRQHYNPAG